MHSLASHAGYIVLPNCYSIARLYITSACIHILESRSCFAHRRGFELCTSMRIRAAMPWLTSSDMASAIENIGKFGKTRCVSQVVEKMVNRTIRKLKRLNSVDPSAAIQLYTAIDDAQLEATMKNRLSECIDKLVTQDTTEVDAKSNRNGQLLITPFNYLTQKDWDTINSDAASYWTIISVVAQRFKKIGIKPPMAEMTVKWTAGTLVANGLERSTVMPSYEAIFQLTKDLKQALRNCSVKAHPDVQSLQIYTETPSQLGQSFMARAYDNDDQPVQTSSAKVSGLVRDHIPIRLRSKLLRKSHNKGIEITAADLDSELMNAQQEDNGKCSNTVLSKPALGSCGASSESLADADSQQQDRPIEAQAVSLFEPKLRLSKPSSPAKPMAIEAQLAIEAPLTIEAPSKGPEQLTLTTPTKSTLETAEEFEDAAFNALSGGPTNVKKVGLKKAPKPPICKRLASAAHAAIAKNCVKSGLKRGCKKCRGGAN